MQMQSCLFFERLSKALMFSMLICTRSPRGRQKENPISLEIFLLQAHSSLDASFQFSEAFNLETERHLLSLTLRSGQWLRHFGASGIHIPFGPQSRTLRSPEKLELGTHLGWKKEETGIMKKNLNTRIGWRGRTKWKYDRKQGGNRSRIVLSPVSGFGPKNCRGVVVTRVRDVRGKPTIPNCRKMFFYLLWKTIVF